MFFNHNDGMLPVLHIMGIRLVSRHFGPKTFRHHQICAEVSRQFGTSAEVSCRHFGTGTELSRPPASIFATTGRTEKGLILLIIAIKEDH